MGTDPYVNGQPSECQELVLGSCRAQWGSLCTLQEVLWSYLFYQFYVTISQYDIFRSHNVI